MKRVKVGEDSKSITYTEYWDKDDSPVGILGEWCNWDKSLYLDPELRWAIRTYSTNKAE